MADKDKKDLDTQMIERIKELQTKVKALEERDSEEVDALKEEIESLKAELAEFKESRNKKTIHFGDW